MKDRVLVLPLNKNRNNIETLGVVPTNRYICVMGETPAYIAYDGDRYRIEFFYDKKGRSQPLEFMKASLSSEDVRKFAQLLVMMGDLGQIRNKESIKIHAGLSTQGKRRDILWIRKQKINSE